MYQNHRRVRVFRGAVQNDFLPRYISSTRNLSPTPGAGTTSRRTDVTSGALLKARRFLIDRLTVSWQPSGRRWRLWFGEARLQASRATRVEQSDSRCF